MHVSAVLPASRSVLTCQQAVQNGGRSARVEDVEMVGCIPVSKQGKLHEQEREGGSRKQRE